MRCGESLLPAAFAIVPVPHSSPGSRSRRLMASRCCHRAVDADDPMRRSEFRGSITRPPRSLSTLRDFPSRSRGRGPRKTRFQLVANLCWAGFEPAGLLRKVSACTCYMASSLPRLAWRTDRICRNSLLGSCEIAHAVCVRNRSPHFFTTRCPRSLGAIDAAGRATRHNAAGKRSAAHN